MDVERDGVREKRERERERDEDRERGGWSAVRAGRHREIC